MTQPVPYSCGFKLGYAAVFANEELAAISGRMYLDGCSCFPGTHLGTGPEALIESSFEFLACPRGSVCQLQSTSRIVGPC